VAKGDLRPSGSHTDSPLMSPNRRSRWTTRGTVSSDFREIEIGWDRLESVGHVAPFVAPEVLPCFDACAALGRDQRFDAAVECKRDQVQSLWGGRNCTSPECAPWGNGFCLTDQRGGRPGEGNDKKALREVPRLQAKLRRRKEVGCDWVGLVNGGRMSGGSGVRRGRSGIAAMARGDESQPPSAYRGAQERSRSGDPL
jgi:hypothetical protein